MKFKITYYGIVLIFVLFLSNSTNAQAPSQKIKKPQHTVNVHYAFTYASDVELNRDRNQHLLGIGYQYTNSRNWYFGVDMQYNKKKRPDYYLEPTDENGFFTYISSTIPGGVGYFTRSNSIEDVNILITSDSIFKTPLSDYPVIKNLFSERYNLYLNAGKKWEKGKNSIETGVSLQGTFFRSFVPIDNSVFSPIPAIFKNGNFPYFYFDGVRNTSRTERTRFVPAGGVHFRYSYQLKPRLWLGLHTLASASEEGFVFQLSPRITYKLR